MSMLDAIMLAAIREEYNAATPAANRSVLGYWRFAAAFICDAFHDNDDDAFYEWTHDIVDKHAAAILAHNPEITQDEELMGIYFDDFDYED